MSSHTDLDVIIIGAGISGIGAAYYVQNRCPDKSYAVIESRANIGGTWDLFRYPGIRSDSDMYTFGFKFKPWVSRKAISPGQDIRDYLEEAATENAIRKKIRFNHKFIHCNWHSEANHWVCTIKNLISQQTQVINAKFIFSCGGYYRYDRGHTPEFPGVENYSGTIIHPQAWPRDFDYVDKKIVVIGSGASAITLVPSLAEKASNVTMLQRSPSYIVARPEQDPIANSLQKFLPTKIAYTLSRWKNIIVGMYLYKISKARPDLVKKAILKDIRKHLGPDFDVEKHFTPSYKPWDQRICLVPDGDLFAAIKHGSAQIVTDTIKAFTNNGIALASGENLEADIVITATGLEIEVLSGYTIDIDSRKIDPSEHYCYKGMMLSDVPNFAFSIGYTNASWTLKSDLVGEYVCRLINHMENNDHTYCVPRVPASGIKAMPLMDFTSNYVVRAQDKMPKQGKTKPWKLYQNYIMDRISLVHGSIEDGHLIFVSDKK